MTTKIEPRDYLPIRNPALLAAALDTQRAVGRARSQFRRGRRGQYTPETQPRDQSGKFRKILARLKSNLGDKQLEQIVQEIRQAQKHDDVGDYAKAQEAGSKVVKMIDDIQDGTLDQNVEKSLRSGAAELGRVLAHLPLPQGIDTANVRFSDLPPATAKLIEGMIDRVFSEINKKDASKFTAKLKQFMSGTLTMSSDEMAAELSKLLRLLADK